MAGAVALPETLLPFALAATTSGLAYLLAFSKILLTRSDPDKLESVVVVVVVVLVGI